MKKILNIIIILLVLIILANYWTFVGDRSFAGWDDYKTRLLRTYIVRARECPRCNGRKMIECPDCKGSGYGKSRKTSKVCPMCHGSGRIEHRFSSGSARCPHCGGKGKVFSTPSSVCERCDGRGRISCPKCRGRGLIPVKIPKLDVIKHDFGSLFRSSNSSS